MYLGCRIHPTSLLNAQPIYLSTAVVFGLYSIRGYRISAGLFVGGVLAYYFSPGFSYFFIPSVIYTLQILLCAFSIRYLLDKLHIALVSMRNLKEIVFFVILSIIIPKFFFGLWVTALGHTVGILSITTIFLVWDAYVPKLSPPPQTKKRLLVISFIWLIIGIITYLFCDYIYKQNDWRTIILILLSYISLILLCLGILTKCTNRFFNVIGLAFIALSVLFYAILHPSVIYNHAVHTIYIQLGLIVVSAFWIGLLAAF